MRTSTRAPERAREQVRPRAAAGHRRARRARARSVTEHELHPVRAVDAPRARPRRCGSRRRGPRRRARRRRRPRRSRRSPSAASAARRGRSPRARSRAARPGRAGAGPGTPFSRRAALELVEPRQVGVAHRDDDLPARLAPAIPLRGAVLVQRVGALAAQPRLQRAGRVVDALVDDAAVVRGLVRAEPPARARAPAPGARAAPARAPSPARRSRRRRPRRRERHASSRSSAAPTTDSASIWWCS